MQSQIKHSLGQVAPLAAILVTTLHHGIGVLWILVACLSIRLRLLGSLQTIHFSCE